MSTPRVFTIDEIREVVSLEDAYESARKAFLALEDDTVTSPFPWHLDVESVRGEVHVKGALLHGEPYFAVKMSAGFPQNGRLGLPTSDGFTTIFDSSTGQVRAILLDGGYLTELRTGAAGAVALDYLAAENIKELAVFGTGGQARFQLDAALCVRTPERVTIYGRNPAAGDALVAWARNRTNADVRFSPLGGDLIQAQAIISTTPSIEPVIRSHQVPPGTHITAVGSDSPGKRELETDLLHKADLVVVDNLSQSEALGELQGIDVSKLRTSTLGTVIRDAWIRNPDAITICDLSGTGAQDSAIASIAALRLLGASA